MISNTKLKKKFKELAARLPQVILYGKPVDHYNNIREVYRTGGQKAVINYCSPFMLQGAVDHLENGSSWKRQTGINNTKQ